MPLPPLLLGLAALASLAEPQFVELFAAPPAGDPAEGVLHVFTGRGPRGDELHVLSPRRTLGVFGFEVGQPTALANPRLRLPAELRSDEAWVFSENSIGTAAFERGNTVYHRLFPPGPDVTRAGSWGVLASYDGSALFFVRGGSAVDGPGEPGEPGHFAVVDENGLRLERETPVRPRIQSSRNGDEFAVQAGRNDFYQIGAAPIELPPGGTLYLQPAAHWLVHELPDRIELRRVTDGLVAAAPASILPPLVAVEFEGSHVLLVSRTRAELLRLGTTTPIHPVESYFGIDATAGHHFSSAALSRRAGERTPWVALGALAVHVPPAPLPDASTPLASAVVRALDSDGREVERWSFDVRAWRGGTPLVQWSQQGRLLASTTDRVLASAHPLR
jgi:hypothetical protein